MLDWLKNHVFKAAWASPIVALIGLIWKKSDPTNPVDWSRVISYVGFLTCLAVYVTPGVDVSVRGTMGGIVLFGFGYLVTSGWNRNS